MTITHKIPATAFAILGLFGIASESALALTGTCTALVNYPVTDTTTNSLHPLNALVTINFDASTVNYNYTVISYPISFEGNWTLATASNVPFTIASGPISGAQTITFTRAAASKNGFTFAAKNISWNIFPANSGKTILVQGQNDNASGVCQF